MKQLVIAAILVSTALASSAQFKRIVVEEVDNGGAVPGQTYRVYAELSHPEDHVHAVYGDKTDALIIECTKPIFQHTHGGALSRDIMRPSIVDHPSLRFDSWFTLGLEDNYVNMVASFNMEESLATFEAGNGFVSHDCTYYATPDASQVYARERNRVLLMQITTEGEFTATINLQGRTVGHDRKGNTLETVAAQNAEQELIRTAINAAKAEREELIEENKSHMAGGGKVTDSVYTDNQKRFDTLNQNIVDLQEAFKATTGNIWKETGVQVKLG